MKPKKFRNLDAERFLHQARRRGDRSIFIISYGGDKVHFHMDGFGKKAMNAFIRRMIEKCPSFGTMLLGAFAVKNRLDELESAATAEGLPSVPAHRKEAVHERWADVTV